MITVCKPAIEWSCREVTCKTCTALLVYEPSDIQVANHILETYYSVDCPECKSIVIVTNPYRSDKSWWARIWKGK